MLIQFFDSLKKAVYISRLAFLHMNIPLFQHQFLKWLNFPPLNYFGTFLQNSIEYPCRKLTVLDIQSPPMGHMSLVYVWLPMSWMAFLSFGKCNKGFDTQTMKRNCILKRWNFECLFVADGEKVGGREGNCLHF